MTQRRLPRSHGIRRYLGSVLQFSLLAFRVIKFSDAVFDEREALRKFTEALLKGGRRLRLTTG